MEETCDVAGCTGPKVKTVSHKEAEKVFSFKAQKTKVHLCKEHYKKFKKETKKDRKIERLTWV